MANTSASPDRANNLAQLFLQRVEKSGDNEAFRIPENGDWTSVTWNQAAERVEALAAGLLSLGVEPEDRIGISSATRLEWVLADLAILCAGAGSFEIANITLTEGIHIAEDPPSAETLLARWAEVADRSGEAVPNQGFMQSQCELKKAGFAVPRLPAG